MFLELLEVLFLVGLRYKLSTMILEKNYGFLSKKKFVTNLLLPKNGVWLVKKVTVHIE